MSLHRYLADSRADTLAFVDEAGGGGYSRKLTPKRDHEVGLVCALLVPAAKLDAFHDVFTCGYRRFVAATPQDAKLHITDAFRPGFKSWAGVARSVRTDFYGLIRKHEVPVVYEARRLGLDRKSYELFENSLPARRSQLDSHSAKSNHPNQSQVEDSLLTGLFLKLDAFCADFHCEQVDLIFDTLNEGVARNYRKILDSTHKISHSSRIQTRRHPDPAERWTLRLETKIEAPFPLDTRFLGDLHVAGKGSPLALATDIVANGLYEHLRNLPADAPLNCPTSVKGWELEGRVYGVRENAFEDRF